MNNENVVLKPAQFGYYFMLRNYKTLKEVKFTQSDIENLLYDFFRSVKNYSYKFFDENNNEITEANKEQFIEDFSIEILDKFATRVSQNDMHYFFNDENIAKMRAEYNNRDTALEYAIVDFETICVYGAFFNRNIYYVYEKGYKQDSKQYQKETEEEVSFDA